MLIEQGNTVNQKVSKQEEYKAIISTLCGVEGTITWLWTLDSGPSLDDDIFNGENSNRITIPANKLIQSSDPYVFTATATQGSGTDIVTGSATISIYGTSSPLYIQLSKTSSDISPSLDFTIDGSASYDPDELEPKLNYDWSCINQVDLLVCKGNDGSDLVNNEKKETLTIASSKLVKGASIELTLTISDKNNERSLSLSATFTILTEDTENSVELMNSNIKVNPQAALIFSANIKATKTTVLKWTELSKNDLNIFPDSFSTVSFFANTLQEDKIYTLQLELEDGNVKMRVQLTININLGPECTDFNVAPETGNALFTTFTLTMNGCRDKDEEDYPLYFIYEAKKTRNNSDIKDTFNL